MMEPMTNPATTDVTTYFKQPSRPKRRRAHNSSLPVARPKPRPTKVTRSMRDEVLRRAGGRCQAEGVHHPNCPGVLPWGDWVPHHVWPRSHGGPDTVDNLIAVWCPGALGLNGCHGRCHDLPFDGPDARPELLRRR